MSYTASSVSYAKHISEVTRALLNDAQTSGGLLVSLPPAQADAYLRAMQERGELAVRIGEVQEKQEAFINID